MADTTRRTFQNESGKTTISRNGASRAANVFSGRNTMTSNALKMTAAKPTKKILIFPNSWRTLLVQNTM